VTIGPLPPAPTFTALITKSGQFVVTGRGSAYSGHLYKAASVPVLRSGKLKPAAPLATDVIGADTVKVGSMAICIFIIVGV